MFELENIGLLHRIALTGAGGDRGMGAKRKTPSGEKRIKEEKYIFYKKNTDNL